MEIKRENWNGSYRIVVREKGRIRSHAKWGKKLTLKTAHSRFKENNTLVKHMRKEVFNTGTVETFDYRDKPRRISGKVQYVIEFTLSDGKTISARSEQREPSYPKSAMKEEAWENALGRLSWHLYGESDVALGKKAVSDMKLKVNEGWVYYT